MCSCLLQSAITIQQHWRGYAVRRRLAEQHKAATAIQVWPGIPPTQLDALVQSYQA